MAGNRGSHSGSNASRSNTVIPDNPPVDPLVNYLVNPPINPPANPMPRRIVIPSSQDEEDDQIQPVLDANEILEIRRLVGSRLQPLTESSNYGLWHTSLLRYLAQYKLEEHIAKRIDPIPGDGDTKILCQTATDIVRSSISTSLMEVMQARYNTDPLGNAFSMVTDAKKAVTQVDIYSSPELFYTMVTSERQNFADTGSYVTQMISIREKLANIADDFKVMDQLFAWLLIHGYKGTDHHVVNDIENNLMRGAKTLQEVIH